MSVERDLLRNYIEARRQYERFNDFTKQAKQKMEWAEEQLTSFMLDKEISSTAKFDDIGYAQMRKPKVIFPSYDKNEEPKLFDFIKERGEEALIKTVIHPVSFSSFVTRLIEDGVAIPPFISYYLRPAVAYYGKNTKQGDT